MKEFAEKKNLIHIGDDEEEEFMKGNNTISTRKNKILMDKMYELMTKKSKTRLRWE